MTQRPGVIQGFFLGNRPRIPTPRHGSAVQPAVRGAAVQLPSTLINFHLGGAGRPLPEAVQRKMETVFGADFSKVRIHTGNEATAIGALAFTQGSDIYFTHGQYNPDSPHGQRLLAHELTHVVQQRSGRVRNPFGSGIAVVHDPGMEAEAERMGIRVSMTASGPRRQPAPPAVQPKISSRLPAPPKLRVSRLPQVPARSVQRSPAPHQRAGVVQGRILFTGTPRPDIGQLVGFDALVRRFPGEAVGHLESDNLGTMDFNETLYLLAHGDTSVVGDNDLSPAALADCLIRRGMKTGTKIVLITCEGGVIRPSRGTTYADELVREVREQSHGAIVVHVQGLTGLGVIMDNGSLRAADVSLVSKQKMEEYQKIIDEGARQNQEAQRYLDEALARGEDLKTMARTVEAIVRGTYRKLYEFQETVTKSGENARSSSGYMEYLRQQDPLYATDPRMLARIREDEHRRWSSTTASYIS